MWKTIRGWFSRSPAGDISPIPEDQKIDLDIAMLMTEIVTKGFMESYYSATSSMMATIRTAISTIVRQGHTIELLLDGNIYQISQGNYRRSMQKAIREPIVGTDLYIRYGRLDIEISDTSRSTVTTLIKINPSNFQGLYVRSGDSLMDLTDIFPSCKSFVPVANVYKSIHSQKSTHINLGENVVQFKRSNKAKT